MNNNKKTITTTQYLEDELMSNIRDSLASQICSVMGEMTDDLTMNDIEATEVSISSNKKIPRWFKISSIVLSVILIVGLSAILTVNAFLGKLNITDWSDILKQDEVFEKGDGTGELIDPNSVNWGPEGSIRQEKNVINILLVGEEAMGEGESRGRTDSIMIATMNVKQKSLKLTSFMRDMYVQIPGYSDNKLNAAYHNGGMPLLKETIQVNFDIELDGAVLVNFDGFEEVIDKLGGVEITLSDSEARYLNSTNYISDPTNRNVKVGSQILNGNQALGYSRVRYRKTESGEADDFGRTSRHRTVLNAIFDKYKSKNMAELVLLMNDILPLVTTDIQKADIIGYLGTFVTLGTKELETLRIPIDNEYTSANIRSMSVLLPNMPANIDALQTFIFGSTDISSNSRSINDNNSETPVDIPDSTALITN